MKPQEAAGIATTVIATLVVGLRVFTKFHIARDRLGLADYLTISAVVASWLFAGLLFPYDVIVYELMQAAAAGADDAVYGQFDLYNAVTGLSFVASLTFGRLAILVFYLRLSPIRYFVYTVTGLITFLCLYTTTSVVMSLLIFSPVVGGKIREADNVLDLTYGIANSFTDICILVLPIAVIAPLQMKPRRKVAVLMLFAAGAFVCATSIWRLTSVTYISKSPPTVEAIEKELVLSFVETNGAIICGCVPIITRFFTQFLPEVVTSYIRSSKPPSSGSFSIYSTTIEKNKQRRAKGGGYGQLHLDQMSTRNICSAADATRNHGNSFSTLDRNVFGKGLADTTISADSQVFAPDQASGITCIQDTRVSYGP